MKPQEWFETRTGSRTAFLSAHGLGHVRIAKVGEDSAFRRYFRLTRDDGSTVILMEAVPDGSPMATPGHSMLDFVRLSAYLRSIGLAAPEVYEVDDAEGYLLIEDFGDTSFKLAQENGVATRADLYALSTDVLSWLRQNGRAGDVDLPDYYASHVHTGRRRVIDWYLPAPRSVQNPDGLVDDYLAVWDAIESGLPSVPRGFLHIDYHFENLMLVPGRSGLARCGVLDFQGAMTGPVPYDLANLLEDARVDVPADLRATMMNRYCQTMTPAERAVFQSWYRVLATQFHCRVIGQFIRLAVRDGKPRYMAMIPRIAGYIRNGLSDPVLAPLAAWFDAQGIDFSVVDGFDPEAIQPLIRPDAF